MTGRNLEGQVRRVYADASIKDPETKTQDLRARRDAICEPRSNDCVPRPKRSFNSRSPSVLVDEGFGAGGEVFPPVAARITPLPYILIISPRDEIHRIDGEGLQAGLECGRSRTHRNASVQRDESSRRWWFRSAGWRLIRR